MELLEVTFWDICEVKNSSAKDSLETLSISLGKFDNNLLVNAGELIIFTALEREK